MEATGLDIFACRRLPAQVSAFVLARGSVQDSRHRESRFLDALAAASQYEKITAKRLLDDAEKNRYPAMIKADGKAVNENALKARARAAIAAGRRGEPIR